MRRLQGKATKRALPNRIPSDQDQMLDVLLALDQMVVEISMKLYNVSRRDRLTMRDENRRLHKAVRTQFPRLEARLSPAEG